MTVTEQLPLALTAAEVRVVKDTLHRELNPTEWAILDAEWSEHCSYKSSREVLKRLPTQGKHVLVGPGYDAGVLDIGDGYVVTVHIESHNHPSAVDPYGGAATGIGGVLRDILATGTRPIALVDPLRFGRIETSAHARWLFKNVVRGIADYGNCVGIPTVAGELEFDAAFERNCLVDVGCVGVGLKQHLVLAEARQPGDLLVLAGGSTGRDGIRGASFASKTLAADVEDERSAVQVPDPFMKKLLLDSTLAAVTTGAVRGLKDLGGGGLACALSEVAAKGGNGLDVELSQVMVREQDLSPTEIMISESQERMLFILAHGREDKVLTILRQHAVPYSVIGQVTRTGELVVRSRGTIVAKLPVGLVTTARSIERPVTKPRYLGVAANVPRPPPPSDFGAVILTLLSSPNIASREWVYRQYDHEVGVRTVLKPGMSDAAVLKLPNGRFLALKSDGNSAHSYLDPYHAAAGCVSEACRNVVAVGAKPTAVVDHLQFGDPGDPEVYWTFVEAVRGLADYCKALRLPIVGGKVSFYNEDQVTGQAVKPSPVVLVLGLIDEAVHIRTMGFKKDGNALLLVGETHAEMGGSELYEHLYGVTGGAVPKVKRARDRTLFLAILHLIRSGVAQAVHDCSKGGLAIALAEMCLARSKGVTVDLTKAPSTTNRPDDLLFSETHGRFLVEVDSAYSNRTVELLRGKGLVSGILGQVGGSTYRIKQGSHWLAELDLDAMAHAWSAALPRLMGGVS